MAFEKASSPHGHHLLSLHPAAPASCLPSRASLRSLEGEHQPLFLLLVPGTLPRFDEVTQNGPLPSLLFWLKGLGEEGGLGRGASVLRIKGSDTVKPGSRTVTRLSNSLLIERRMSEFKLTVPDVPLASLIASRETAISLGPVSAVVVALCNACKPTVAWGDKAGVV